MSVVENSKQLVRIPSSGTVDDRNTIESQLIGIKREHSVPGLFILQVENYLEDLHYPASKTQILNYARLNGASENILSLIRTIPRRTYMSIEQIINRVN